MVLPTDWITSGPYLSLGLRGENEGSFSELNPGGHHPALAWSESSVRGNGIPREGAFPLQPSFRKRNICVFMTTYYWAGSGEMNAETEGTPKNLGTSGVSATLSGMPSETSAT